MKFILSFLFILSLTLGIVLKTDFKADNTLLESEKFRLFKKTPEVAIIYIATGNYIVFWDNFYKFAEKNFLPGVKKHYFLISNHSFNELPNNVTHIYYPHKKWPSIALEKFGIIYSLKDKLINYTYTYSFNSNSWIISPIMEDIIPNDTQKIIATLHPSFFKTDTQYPYCSDKNSLAYLVQTKNSQYYQSGLIGGKTKDFLEMARIISEWTSIDLKKNYIPIWHDESYFNKYVSDKNPLILTPNYLWGSFPNKQAIDLFSNDIKIVILNKERLKNTGMDYFRDIELVDNKPKYLSNFFYVSYKNGDSDFISFNNNSFYVTLREKQGKFKQEGDLYKFDYKTKHERCFKTVKESTFFYEINCP